MKSDYPRAWRYAFFDIFGDCSVTIPSCVECCWPWILTVLAQKAKFFPIGGNVTCFLIIITLLVIIRVSIEFGMNLFSVLFGKQICESRTDSPDNELSTECAIAYSVEVIGAIASVGICYIVFMLRNEIRRQRNIGTVCLPSNVEDAAAAFCCTPCTILQTSREVDATSGLSYCVFSDSDEQQTNTNGHTNTLMV